MKKSPFATAALTTVILLLCTLLAPGPEAGASGEQDETRQAESKDEEKQKPEEETAAVPVSPLVKATGGKSRSADTPTYSNEDLQKMFGGGGQAATVAPTATPSAEPPGEGGEGTPQENLLEQFRERDKALEEQRAGIADAEKRIVELEQNVKQLERDALAERNPLLARPKPPEDEEERAEWDRADGVGRVELIDQRLDAAREALAKAKEELATLRKSAP